MKGKRRCRQKKMLEDNIKGWTGMDLASSTRAAENRTWWKSLLQIHRGAPTTFQGYGTESNIICFLLTILREGLLVYQIWRVCHPDCASHFPHFLSVLLQRDLTGQ